MVRHGEHGTRILPAAIATVLLVAGLTIAAAFRPSALTWGFHFLAFLPPAYFAGFAGAVALLLWFALRGDVDGLVRRPAQFMEGQPVAFLAIAVGTFALVATLLRVGAPLLGDSFYLVRNYSEAARGVAPLYFRNEPLATLAFSLLLDLFGMGTFAEFLSSFLGAEILLGAATIVCVFFTLRLLVRDPGDRLLAFAFVMAFPMMQLYFGYVEIYAAVVLAVAAFALLAALHLTGKLRFRYLPLAFLGVALTHYGTVVLFPALLVLAWRERQQHGPRELALGAGIAAGAVMTLLVMVGFDVERYSSWVPHSHFLPLAFDGDEAERYTSAFTLLSPFHFLDVANLILLVAPASLLLVAYTVATNARGLLSSALHRFFLAGLVPALAFLFAVKYDLGGARDWDVFTFVYFFLALYAAVLTATSEAAGKRRTLFLLGGLTAITSFLFFSVNHRDEAGEARFRALFDRRLLSQAGYYSGSLYLAQYQHQVGRSAEAVEVWRAYLREFPGDGRAYRNVLTNAMRSAPLSDAETAELFEGWLDAAGHDGEAPAMYAAWCAEAGARRESRGDHHGAEALYRRAVELAPLSARSLEACGMYLARTGREAEALLLLERSSAIDSTSGSVAWHLSRLRTARGERAEALFQLTRAARLGYPGAAEALAGVRSAPKPNDLSITLRR